MSPTNLILINPTETKSSPAMSENFKEATSPSTPLLSELGNKNEVSTIETTGVAITNSLKVADEDPTVIRITKINIFTFFRKVLMKFLLNFVAFVKRRSSNSII